MGTTMLSSLSKKDKEHLIHELKDFYIPYRSNLNLSRNTYFGFEIEFKIPKYDGTYISNFIDENNAAEFFLKERDYNFSYDIESEINNHIELISPILTDCNETWQELYGILNFIKSNNGTIDEGMKLYNSVSCGAHVHVGRNIFDNNPNGWLNFFKLWSIFEEHIFKFTNGEYYNLRDNGSIKTSKINNICVKIINDYNYFQEIDFSYLINNKINCINFNTSFVNGKPLNMLKKVGNPQLYDKSKTIEFRSPNGTLNEIIWQNNVNIFTKMLLSCVSNDFDIEKMNFLYKNKAMATENNLCDLVFVDDFDKKCFLRQYHKDFSHLEKGASSKFWK